MHFVQTGQLTPMAIPKGLRIPLHTMYADDIIIFYKGTKKNIDNLNILFNDNYAKSSYPIVVS